VSSVETLFAALAVSFTRRSSPVRKFGADVGLLARLAIIFNCQQGSCFKADRQRAVKQGAVVNKILKSRLAFNAVVISFRVS
jgi:hypothetical protein